MTRIVCALLFCALLLGVPVRARAQSCSATASAINFGSVSPIRGNTVNATGTINVTCTWPLISLTPNVLVCLNLSAATPLALTNSGNSLRYGLFQDSGHSVPWGSTYNGTTPIALTLFKPLLGTFASQSVTIYGQIAGSQQTVPTVGDISTVYSHVFSGTQTSLNYVFFLLGAPGCASLPSDGTFAFTTSATVVNDCTINTTNVAFTTSSLLNAALNATGSLTVQCTNNDAYRIALNGGGSGNPASRQMQRVGGGGAVSYQLYVDAGHTVAWGDGTGGTSMAAGIGSGLQQVIAVYGVVPAQTTPAPGNYSDTITATIYF
jgi:spore coat protein U-like protein